MTQTGYNTGPRHAKAFGLAVSYTKKLDEETKILHDRDIIAAGSLLWNLVLGNMPSEVIEETTELLRAKGLPDLRTQHVTPGKHGQTRTLHCIPQVTAIILTLYLI